VAIKIQGTTVIDDDLNIDNANSAVFTGTSHVKLPSGDISQRPNTPSEGMIRYNSEEETFEGYSNGEWGSIGGGGGFEAITSISANTTAISSNFYVLTSSNIVLTLPVTPASGNYVGVSNRSNTITCVIGRNGSNIMGLAENMTLDVVDAGFVLYYVDSTQGWIIG
jgi:hypothetical protein